MLPLPGEMSPGQFGPIRTASVVLEVVDREHHLADGDRVGDAHDQLAAGGLGLEHRVRCRSAGHEDEARVAPGRVGGFGHRVEHRDAPVERALPALARRDTGDDLRAVVEVAGAVERAFASGQSLDADARVFGEEDRHSDVG